MQCYKYFEFSTVCFAILFLSKIEAFSLLDILKQMSTPKSSDFLSRDIDANNRVSNLFKPTGSADSNVKKAVLPIPPFGQLTFMQNQIDGSLAVELSQGLDAFGYGAYKKSKFTIGDDTLIHESGGNVKIAGEDIGFMKTMNVETDENEKIDFKNGVDITLGRTLTTPVKNIFEKFFDLFYTFLPKT